MPYLWTEAIIATVTLPRLLFTKCFIPEDPNTLWVTFIRRIHENSTSRRGGQNRAVHREAFMSVGWGKMSHSAHYANGMVDTQNAQGTRIDA